MNLLPFFVIVPLGAAFITPVFSRFWKGFPDWLGNLSSAFLMGLSFWCLRFTKDTLVYYAGGWEPFDGIPVGIAMVMDGLTILMLLIINVIAFLVMIYSVPFITNSTDKGKYYTLLLLMLTGLNGFVLAGDIFNLFVFLEITSIASFALVAFGLESESFEASFKYQVLGGVASLIILLGIAFLYHLTGTLNMADASRILNNTGSNPAVLFVGTLLLVGFSFKAGMIPFHAWLPDAYPSAPASISAMLAGAGSKVLGVYALIRIFFNVFGMAVMPSVLSIFLILGTLSMVVGSLLALGQKDFKRLLAYSSIGQIGYAVFALGLGTPLGILGGLFHLLNHSVFKSLLFLNSGAIVYATGNRDLESMGGLSQRMRVTSTTSLIGSLSVSGIPPLGGFWSKLIIIIAAVESGQHILAGVAILVSIVTLAYYMKVQKLAFFGTLGAAYQKVKEVPVLMCVPMVVLALLSLGLGILLLPQLRAIVLDPAVKVIEQGVGYAEMVLGG